MIKKLKIKFILLSALSLFLLLFLIIAGMNLLNYNAVVSEADEILSLLSQNRGVFPDTGTPGDRDKFGDFGKFEDFKDRRPISGLSPELPYESRYFSVLFDENGEVLFTDTSRIISVDEETAAAYAGAVWQKSADRGFWGDFRYTKTAEGSATRITFLDCGRKLDAARRFLTISILMALSGFLAVVLIISFFAGKIIRPIAESYEKQKRFITDAGHEIKTPLTIINANVDILEMDLENNECLEDIRQQAKRLTTLTDDLVTLARMEEAENPLPMIEFPISEIVQEAASPFQAVAQAQGKALDVAVQPLLSMRGNDKAVQQLVSILLDNALKYAPVGSTARLSLTRQNRTLLLTVSNPTQMEFTPEALRRVFDRFYRTDPSRNSETGGHGIGLSIAKAIVTAHGGKISAASPDGHAFQITATLPI